MQSNSSQNSFYLKANAVPNITSYDYADLTFFQKYADDNFEYRFYAAPGQLMENSSQIVMFNNPSTSSSNCIFMFQLAQTNTVVFDARVYFAALTILSETWKFFFINYSDPSVNVSHGLVAGFNFTSLDSESTLNCYFKPKSGNITIYDFSASSYPTTPDVVEEDLFTQTVYEQIIISPSSFVNGTYLMAVVSSDNVTRNFTAFMEIFSIRNTTFGVPSDTIISHTLAWKFFNLIWNGTENTILTISTTGNGTNGLQIYLKFGDYTFKKTEYQYTTNEVSNSGNNTITSLTISPGALSIGAYTIAVYNSYNTSSFSLTVTVSQVNTSSKPNNPFSQGLIIAIIVAGVVTLLFVGAFVYIIFLRKEKNYYKSISLEDNKKGLLDDEKKIKFVF